ncbi:MAG TPA: hypothetical protein VF151_10745 [Gemmatimonadales bacterium]
MSLLTRIEERMAKVLEANMPLSVEVHAALTDLHAHATQLEQRVARIESLLPPSALGRVRTEAPIQPLTAGAGNDGGDAQAEAGQQGQAQQEAHDPEGPKSDPEPARAPEAEKKE